MTICCLQRADRHRIRVRTATALSVLLTVLLRTPEVGATPYVPQSADTVLLQLTAPPSHTRAKAITSSSDSLLAAALQEISTGRATLDERYFGRARALLTRALPCVNPETSNPFERCAAEPELIPALVAYADALQHGHQFDVAIHVLDSVLERDATNSHARMMRASIRLAQGEPTLAMSDCKKVLHGDSFIGTACIAQSISLNGRLHEAIALLNAALANNDQQGAQPAWAQSILAELFERAGSKSDAIIASERALASDPENLGQRLRTVDLLLRCDRTGRASDLLIPLPNVGAVVLRRALVATRLNQPQAATLRDHWRAIVHNDDRFGLASHERDRAIGELALLNRPHEALRHALQNWKSSRELDDARVLIASALAASRRSDAAPAVEWLSRLRIEDAVIDELLTGPR
jgi:tetratricopeptide (TPR) repeat protein